VIIVTHWTSGGSLLDGKCFFPGKKKYVRGNMTGSLSWLMLCVDLTGHGEPRLNIIPDVSMRVFLDENSI
jgi:hypothetical protein